jgi:PiT family inorganic phosphate transporter
MIIPLLFFSALFLAYWNGANDNFKGVATLYGSGTVSYLTAIALATVATFAGSICAIFIAQGLVESFSGKGLVPQDLAGTPDFLVAVGFGAAITVLLATRMGLPISTTHSLLGGLLGAGLVAAGAEVNLTRLLDAFLVPLLVSPFIAGAMAGVAYLVFTRARRAMGVTKESCVCVGERREFVAVSNLQGIVNGEASVRQDVIGAANPDLAVTLADLDECVDMYTDRVWGFRLQRFLDLAHGCSAAMVSFARGLNDTPKIAALLVVVGSSHMGWSMLAIAAGIAAGGLINARRVAETISKKITTLNHGQGFSANLVTGLLVIVASKFGVPVSTTHVSVGAIFGIGLVSGDRDNSVMGSILFSWLVTLPFAMFTSAAIFWLVGTG